MRSTLLRGAAAASGKERAACLEGKGCTVK